MEMANKTLALLLVAAIIISLGGTLVSINKINQGITGLAAGKVNLSIISGAACSIPYNISFGDGSQPTSANAILGTDKANAIATTPFNDCTSNVACEGILINNTGNTILEVNFTSDVTGATLLGGQTGASVNDFKYWAKNGTQINGGVPGCIQGLGAYANVATTNQVICQRLNYTDGTDTATVEFNLTLQPDIPPGTKTATLTITCI